MRRKVFAWAFFLISFLNTRYIFAQTLQEMDRILTQAGGVHEFLARPELVDAYFKSATAYFGPDTFSRASYDKLLSQLKVIIEAHPDIAKRAWEVPPEDHFNIKSEVAIFGHTLNIQNWDAFIEDKINNLPLMNESEAADRSEEYKKKYSQIRERAEGLKGGDLALHFEKSFKELNEDPRFVELAKHSARQILEKTKIRDAFRSNDPELILRTLDEINDEKLVLDTSFGEMPGFFTKGVQSFIPKTSDLKSRQDLFPRVQRKTMRGDSEIIGSTSVEAYEFKTLPRLFHGIWRGFPINECIAGDPKNLASMTPYRWMTALLTNSQLHFVEQGGKFKGSTSLQRGTVRGTKAYAAEFGCTDLNKGIIRGDKTGVPEKLVEVWLANRMDALGAPILISNTDHADNAGVLRQARTSPMYALGNVILEKGASARDGNIGFVIDDPKLEEFNKASALIVRSGKDILYKDMDRMDIDATQKGSPELRSFVKKTWKEVLSPENIQHLLNECTEEEWERYKKLFDDNKPILLPKESRVLIETSVSPQISERVQERALLLSHSMQLSKEFFTSLKKQLHSKNAPKRRSILEALVANNELRLSDVPDHALLDVLSVTRRRSNYRFQDPIKERLSQMEVSPDASFFQVMLTSDEVVIRAGADLLKKFHPSPSEIEGIPEMLLRPRPYQNDLEQIKDRLLVYSLMPELCTPAEEDSLASSLKAKAFNAVRGAEKERFGKVLLFAFEEAPTKSLRIKIARGALNEYMPVASSADPQLAALAEKFPEIIEGNDYYFASRGIENSHLAAYQLNRLKTQDKEVVQYYQSLRRALTENETDLLLNFINEQKEESSYEREKALEALGNASGEREDVLKTLLRYSTSSEKGYDYYAGKALSKIFPTLSSDHPYYQKILDHMVFIASVDSGHREIGILALANSKIKSPAFKKALQKIAELPILKEAWIQRNQAQSLIRKNLLQIKRDGLISRWRVGEGFDALPESVEGLISGVVLRNENRAKKEVSPVSSHWKQRLSSSISAVRGLLHYCKIKLNGDVMKK